VKKLFEVTVSCAGVIVSVPGTKDIVYLVEVSPEHVTGYGLPLTGLSGVAGLVQESDPESTDAVSAIYEPTDRSCECRIGLSVLSRGADGGHGQVRGLRLVYVDRH